MIAWSLLGFKKKKANICFDHYYQRNKLVSKWTLIFGMKHFHTELFSVSSLPVAHVLGDTGYFDAGNDRLSLSQQITSSIFFVPKVTYWYRLNVIFFRKKEEEEIKIKLEEEQKRLEKERLEKEAELKYYFVKYIKKVLPKS